MTWDDSDFGIEYAKFEKATLLDSAMTTENTYVLYCEILWDTIDDYTNQWNKKRKKVRVNPIILSDRTPYISDEVRLNENLYLDMGSRLFSCLKELAKKKPKYVKIIKEINPRNKFDVDYTATSYKLKIQKDLASNTKKKAAK